MKGVAKLELINKETGEIKTIVEQNMVTDTIQRIANVMYHVKKSTPLIQDYIDKDYTTLLLSGYIHDYFKGILLYSEPLELNSENTFPVQAGSQIVGYAGSGYASEATDIGVYNGEESGEIEGGYRHVFDFSTDKVNATIKAIGLINRHTAGTKLGVNVEHKTLFTEYYETSMYNSSTIDGVSGGISVYHYKPTNTHLYSTTSAGVYRKAFVNYNALNVLTKPSSVAWELVISKATWDAVAVLDDYIWVIRRVSSYKVGSLEKYTLDGTLIATYDLSSLTDVAMPVYTSYGYTGTFAVVGNKIIYYAYTSSTHYMVEIDFVELTCVNTNLASLGIGYLLSSSTFYNITPDLYAAVCVTSHSSSYTSRYGAIIFENGVFKQYVWIGGVTRAGSSYIPPRYYPEHNFMLSSYSYNDWYPKIDFVLPTGHLTTKNNLETPIVKTSAEVLKITYDILWS